jgi:uncharacterized protein (UPF0332 family)
MDPIQFLRLAEALLRDHAHAAGWRTAVSRAYYSAHHIAKAFVEGASVHVVGGAAAHGDVWNHLVNVGDAEIEWVGGELSNLHGERIEADYQLAKLGMQNQQRAALKVAQARALIEIIERCRNDVKRYAQITKAIQSRHRILRGTRSS